jgi:hypothetical protein
LPGAPACASVRTQRLRPGNSAAGLGFMRAYVLNSYGGPDSAALQQAPEPVAGPTDLLVRVRAVGSIRSTSRRGKASFVRL